MCIFEGNRAKDLADASVVKRVEEVETLRREQFETFVKERSSEKKNKEHA